VTVWLLRFDRKYVREENRRIFQSLVMLDDEMEERKVNGKKQEKEE